MRTPATSVQRAIGLGLLGLTVLLTVAQGLTGLHELALYFAPLLLLAGLLLSGRYIGEERIVRAVRNARHRRLRAPRVRAPRTPDRTLRSLLLASASRSLRGPPRPLAA